MTVSLTVIELVWVALNLCTFILTLAAYLDARASRKAVKLLNGHARELAASNIVRREGFRLITQGLLLAAVLPLLFRQADVQLTPTVSFLMLVPLVLLASSAFDARDRRSLVILSAADILNERELSHERFKAEQAALDASDKDAVMNAVQTLHDVAAERRDHPTS